jgi:uncharacterized protein YbjT (DUF2867 family)
MSDTILITGATGTLGTALVPLLEQAGAKLRLTSRSEHRPDRNAEWVQADIATGSGLDTALRGIRTVVHCAGSPGDDGALTRNLVDAAVDADVDHFVHVSVVGADTVPVVGAVDRALFGYFAAKRAAENVITRSPIPWTMLRPTQFHDFVTTVMEQMIKLPVLPLWRGVSFQPVDTQDVARRLAELSLGEPAGIVPPLGGPTIYPMELLARDYLAVTERRRAIVNVPIPGRAAAAFRAGANLTPAHPDGTTSWEDFLAARFPERATVTSDRR